MKGVSKLFAITTLLVFPLAQAAIDLYLPSLPPMAVALATSKFLLQLTLTAYILSLGIAQLIYGPCSDRFGRKPVLLTGTAIFLIGSISCTFAISITQLIICRIIQGIGMGCGFTVASAIIGDSFKGKQLARMITFSSMIYSLSLIIAPVLGGYLQHYIGWRANFAFMAIFTSILLIMIIFFIHETNSKLDPYALLPKKFLGNYLGMFTSLKFISNIGCLLFAFGVMVTFNVVGPFLLQNVLHVSALHYGQLLLLVGISYFAGTSLNSQLLKYYRINSLIVFGMLLMLFFGCGLLISGVAGWFSASSIMLFTCLVIFSSGFVFPNCFARALEVFSNNLGAASALIGSLALIGNSAISVIVAKVHSYHEQALGYMFLVQTLFCMLLYLLTRDKTCKNKR